MGKLAGLEQQPASEQPMTAASRCRQLDPPANWLADGVVCRADVKRSTSRARSRGGPRACGCCVRPKDGEAERRRRRLKERARRRLRRRLQTDALFIYETPKVVLIKNKKIGMVFRAVQTFILAYFVVWVMWWEKGYQFVDEPPISGVTTRVNGLAWSEIRDGRAGFAAGPKVWDDGDYSIPPQQNSGFFVVTRVVHLTEQSVGVCAESARLFDAHCLEDSHCPRGGQAGSRLDSVFGRRPADADVDVDASGHGVFTGRCLTNRLPASTPDSSPALPGTCEVLAWCPVVETSSLSSRAGQAPADSNPRPVPDDTASRRPANHNRRQRRLVPLDESVEPLYDALNYTVFIKHAIEFTAYRVNRPNVLKWMTNQYLADCRNNKDDPRDKYCPIFRLGDIIRWSGANTYRMLRHGGVIAVTIDWQCDLDFSVDWCLPTYGFRQMDTDSTP
ncbi:unnamed protein product, partial [Protopolystoma xenopodis]